MITIIILVAVIGMLKAVSDTLAYHFDKSIFKNLNRQFFDPSVSWLNKYVDKDFSKGINKKVFQPFSDAWHLSNSVMICCIVALPFIPHGNIHGVIGYAVAGLINVCTFNLFYNKILKP